MPSRRSASGTVPSSALAGERTISIDSLWRDFAAARRRFEESLTLFRTERGELGLIGDQVDKAPAHPVAVFAAFVFASHSAVLLAVMIEAQSAGNDDEPGREFAASVGAIPAQTMKVVSTKLLQHQRVAIHHVVVIAAE